MNFKDYLSEATTFKMPDKIDIKNLKSEVARVYANVNTLINELPYLLNQIQTFPENKKLIKELIKTNKKTSKGIVSDYNTVKKILDKIEVR